MAQTAFAYAKQALAETPPVDATMAQLTEWIAARTRTIELLDGATRRLPEPEPTGLFAMILMAVTLDDLIRDINELPVPSDAKGDSSFSEVSYREQLERIASPLLKKAALRYERCSQLMPEAAPALQVWREHCRTRADELASLAVRMASRRSSTPR